MLPYPRLVTTITTPFFVFAIESEATGGNIKHAEDRAAVRGTDCVRSMQTVLDELGHVQTNSTVESAAFSVAATGRLLVFYIHYFSEEKGVYCMSCIKSFATTDPEHVQECHDLVQNILDFGTGVRLDRWLECIAASRISFMTQACSATDNGGISTPDASFITAPMYMSDNE